jgi:glycogen(starch) synthase
MRIAHITYEYPPHSAYGGIATYVHQSAKMLHEAGHEVEVFTTNQEFDGTTVEDGITVHWVKVPSKRLPRFWTKLEEAFAARLKEVSFDVIETPEHWADARAIVASHPHIPYVVRCHNPSYMQWRTNLLPDHVVKGLTPFEQARYKARYMCREILYRGLNTKEQAIASGADVVAAAHGEMQDYVQAKWNLPKHLTRVVPHPFQPHPTLLNAKVESNSKRFLFLGRLESRKGIHTIAEALPQVLGTLSDWSFHFVGAESVQGFRETLMRRLVHLDISNATQRVVFHGKQPYDKSLELLSQADVIVMPSVWENWPNVCLEAMSAARGIIASSQGGMASMIGTDRKRGILLDDPNNASHLAGHMLTMAGNPEMRQDMGLQARNHVLENYTPQKILPLTEQYYRDAIQYHTK